MGALGRLAAQYNVHRLATLIEPLGAFALLCLVAGLSSVRGRRRAGCAALAMVTFVAWSTMADSAVRGPQAARALVVAGLAAGLFVWFVPRPSTWPRSWAIAVVAALSIVTLIAATGGSLGEVGYDRGLPTVRAALAIKKSVPDSAIIAAPPDMYWLRAISQRSVVADCKAVPYGGAPWDEYMRRMEALGGNCRGRAHGWRSLTADDVEALRGRYGVTHVLLYDDDPKVDYARNHWRPVFRAEAEDVVFFEHGFVLYDVAGPGRAASAPAG